MKTSLQWFFTFLFFCSMSSLKAQNPSSSGQLNIGHFYGKIIDNESLKGIDGASVILLKSNMDTATKKKKDIIAATIISTKNGDFNIENISVVGTYTLNISAVGYKPVERKIAFDRNAGVIDKDLGNIKLIPDAQQLQAVTVSASKPLLELSLDKKIYNVEKDISVTGGTAIDVMKNVPSVNVDIDGNVTLRNAAPQIFVDGRPTTLTLDQIPADQIATVEIITNPSAKYDASGGGAGILNIVLKKNRKIGYNGNLRASIDSRGRPGFGGDINYKQNKINFFASSYVGFRKSVTDVSTERTDFIAPDSTAHYIQKNKPVINGLFAFGRMGFDYLIDNRNTLTISGSIVNGHFKVHDLLHTNTDTTGPSGAHFETADRTLKANIHFRNYGGSIGFKHNFARAGKELTADANYIYSENTNTSDYQTFLYDQNGYAKPLQGALRATGGGNSNTYTIQTDYADPFTQTQKIEFGLRAAIRDNINFNDNYLKDPATLMYILLPQIGVKYNFTDKVYAAYGTYSQQIKNFSYQAGIRIESSEYDGNYITRNEKFGNKYPFSFFPSIYMSYKIDDKQDLQLNYSRKINRPNFFQLIPFVDFSDSLNLSVGNPDLKPEFTHLIEASYSNQYSPGNTVLISFYVKITDDLITRYQFDSLINPAKLARYITYANANKSCTEGIEITGKNKITKWWDLTSNFNFYNVNIKAGNIPGVSNSQLSSFFGKLNNSFKLPNNYSIQLSGDYQAKTLIPPGSSGGRGGGGGMYGAVQTTAQGYIKSTYGVDIAIKKDFLKNNRASLTLQFSDILRTRVYETHAETPLFVQDNYRLRDPQILRLNFSFRFGKVDANLFKRKNLKGEQENIQNIQATGQ